MNGNKYYTYGLALAAAVFLATVLVVIVVRSPAESAPKSTPGSTTSQWWEEDGQTEPPEFRVTSVQVEYLTGRDVMRYTTVAGITATSRVAKVTYGFANLGKDEITVTPETMQDTQGRSYEADWIIHPRDSAAPGTDGLGTGYAVVAPDAKVNRIGITAWGPGGVGTDGRGSEEVKIGG